MSINIDIDGEWGIQSDAYNIIIGKWGEKENKEGDLEKVLKSRRYVSTISGALKEYKKLQVRSSDAESFENLAELVKELDNKIEGITEELGV